MRHLRIVMVLLALCTVVAVAALEARAASSKKATADRIPKIARILGVRVGTDTIERLERILGPGKAITGGHPNGARVWYLKRQEVYVYADGFDYSAHGRIIDTVRISRTRECMGVGVVPRVDIHSKHIGWLGSMLPGMSRAAVTKLAVSLPKPETKADTVRWKMTGIYEPYADEGPATWVAEMTFRNNRLVTIEVRVGS